MTSQPPVDFTSLIDQAELRPDPQRGEMYVGFRASSSQTVYRLYVTGLTEFQLVQVEGNRIITDEPTRQAALDFLRSWFKKEKALDLDELAELLQSEGLPFWRVEEMAHCIQRQRDFYRMFMAGHDTDREAAHNLYMLGLSYYLAGQSELPTP